MKDVLSLPPEWSAEQMAQASDVLDAATTEKRARLLGSTR